MDRRAFIGGAALGPLVTPRPAWAQRVEKVARIAFLYNNVPVADMEGAEPVERSARAFVHGLRDLGFVEGRNISSSAGRRKASLAGYPRWCRRW